MTTRFIFVAMQLFGVAGAAAIAVALLAPIDAIRFLGVVAFAFAGAGLLVQVRALQRFDPQAYRLLRFRFRAALKRARALVARGTGKLASAIHNASSPRSAR